VETSDPMRTRSLCGAALMELHDCGGDGWIGRIRIDRHQSWSSVEVAEASKGGIFDIVPNFYYAKHDKLSFSRSPTSLMMRNPQAASGRHTCLAIR